MRGTCKARNAMSAADWMDMPPSPVEGDGDGEGGARLALSARHLPNEIYAIPEVPRTMSGKKLEVPVKKILLGQPVEKSVNKDSMANPGSIDWFVAFGAARSAGGR